MNSFDKLIKRLIVHEAFDKVLPIKPRHSRKSEDIESDLRDVDRETRDELRRKEYATNRMSWSDSDNTRYNIGARGREQSRSLEKELAFARDEDGVENLGKFTAEEENRLRDDIMARALKRQGSPKKEIMELPSVQRIIKYIIRSYLYKKVHDKQLNATEHYSQYIPTMKQVFESKSGLMAVMIAPYFDFNSDANLQLKSTNGLCDISFRPAQGIYDELTGGGDATQIIATVMEIAFAVFSVLEAGMKVCFPEFYEYKKRVGGKVIKFSGVGNQTFGMNANSKTAKEGSNKRNRLYMLGWERAMRKRATDLELVGDNGPHATIYINYKPADEGGGSSDAPTEDMFS